MKIIIEDLKEGEEEEIIIRSNNIDESILQMIYGIKNEQNEHANEPKVMMILCDGRRIEQDT